MYFGPMEISFPYNNYRHKDGGWLSAQNPWTKTIQVPGAVMPNSSTRLPSASKQHLSTPSTASNGNYLDSDPVVKLLGTAGKLTGSREPLPMTLIKAISKESEIRPSVTFPLPFRHSLPGSLQDTWLALIERQLMLTATSGRSAMSILSEDKSLQFYR
jgi:hypothetical protein